MFSCFGLFWWLVRLFGFCRVLVGTGRACYETLRPLAYSLLAEIVHHVRADLSLPQVFVFEIVHYSSFLNLNNLNCNFIWGCLMDGRERKRGKGKELGKWLERVAIKNPLFCLHIWFDNHQMLVYLQSPILWSLSPINSYPFLTSNLIYLFFCLCDSLRRWLGWRCWWVHQGCVWAMVMVMVIVLDVRMLMMMVLDVCGLLVGIVVVVTKSMEVKNG